MLFDPPMQLDAAVLIELGFDLDLLYVIKTRSRTLPGADSLWSLEQALKSGHVGAVLAWLPPRLRTERIRRLQLAAHNHDGLAFVVRELACFTVACTSPSEVFSRPDDLAFLSPQANHASLIVVRAGSVPEDGCSYLVALDNKVAGKLTANGWITMYPSTGTHLLSLRPEGVTCAREVQTRIWIEAARSSRVQLIRAPNGDLRWDNDGRAP